MDEKQIMEAAKVFKADFPIYAKNVLKVVNKEGGMVPFRLKAASGR